MKFTTRSISRSAVIAALYVLLTFVFQAISFGAVQFRVSEAMMLLPLISLDAVPGLFIGCLLANILGGAVWFDVLLGALASLLAALAVYRLKKHPLIAAAMPALFNGLIVGPVVYFAYVRAPGAAISYPVLFSSMASVAVGEIAVCYVLGLLMIRALRRIPEDRLR